ncbi:hypothetical protein SAMN04487972_12125 [Paracoccus halophilus]|uniref:Uncharacterized protein n=1 Tax=Paracoccus halophilus TaxID=376733 RepID=A0A1I0U3D3_9RHOB|nr:hypothetical protein SAMN04487972_12125 [Paracoccus halophilus]
MASGAILTIRATTSSQVQRICGRCGTAMAMSQPCLPPTMRVPVAMTNIWRRAALCSQKRAPMLPRSHLFSATGLRLMCRRSCRRHHRIGAKLRFLLRNRAAIRRRPIRRRMMSAQPFLCAFPSIMSRRTAAYSWPVLATEIHHEHGFFTLLRFASGVQSGKGSPGCIHGSKGKKGREGGGQDKGNRHPVGSVSRQALVCTLFWGAAHGTLLLGLACRDMAQSLGLTGF